MIDEEAIRQRYARRAAAEIVYLRNEGLVPEIYAEFERRGFAKNESLFQGGFPNVAMGAVEVTAIPFHRGVRIDVDKPLGPPDEIFRVVGTTKDQHLSAKESIWATPENWMGAVDRAAALVA
ncbi:hypothetical protein CMO91_05310 [Candidatus Woesearchaeota archaeon]|nr:hypothetical protein [Candidatus Woesearchaeota archaeon]